MKKLLGILAVAAAVVMVGAQAAHAGETCILWFCWPTSPGGGGSPAPAPLLAAGIPAFTALGGGVLVSKLLRRRKTQA